MWHFSGTHSLNLQDGIQRSFYYLASDYNWISHIFWNSSLNSIQSTEEKEEKKSFVQRVHMQKHSQLWTSGVNKNINYVNTFVQDEYFTWYSRIVAPRDIRIYHRWTCQLHDPHCQLEEAHLLDFNMLSYCRLVFHLLLLSMNQRIHILVSGLFLSQPCVYSLGVSSVGSSLFSPMSLLSFFPYRGIFL